jgi:hypothetical protein
VRAMLDGDLAKLSATFEMIELLNQTVRPSWAPNRSSPPAAAAPPPPPPHTDTHAHSPPSLSLSSSARCCPLPTPS